MRFEVGSATDRGMVRDTNQDRFLVHGNLVAVADGMGGHAGGELAAETAVEDMRRFPTMEEPADVVAGIHHANREVLAAAERTGMTSMGTTMVAALLRPSYRSVVLGNVGDSRAYFYSGGELAQITEDHSLVEDLIRAGKISEEEARDHPHRNVVTRVLGLSEDPDVDIFQLAVSNGDVFLLASDGLFNEVDHQVIATILENETDLDTAAERLVERANQNGGHDNITVVIGRVVDEDPVVAEPASAAAIAEQADENPATTAAPSDEADTADSDALSTDAVTTDAVTGDSLTDGDDDPVDATVGGEARQGLAIIDDDPVERSLDPPTDELPVVTKPRRRRMRAFVFAVCVLALLGLGAGGLVAYGRNAWFVDTVANEVVIHRGRPGGVLFIEPQAVQPTGIDINDLNPGSRRLVADIPVFSSLDEAETFVADLQTSTFRESE